MSFLMIMFWILVGFVATLVIIGFPHIIYGLIASGPYRTYPPAKKNYKYACVLAARNEEKVIGHLIDSIKKQDYPSGLVDIIVIADNCTDKTAEIARSKGVIVYERHDPKRIGKGYALDYGLNRLYDENPDADYEGFFFFDADNLLKPDFITQMNKAVNQGHQIITGHLIPKNYNDWIAAGSGLMFLHQNTIVHKGRAKLGTSTYFCGTGSYVSAKVIKEQGGWPYHCITEDVEFSHDKILKGYKITSCYDAIYYDEQPSNLKDTLAQRTRWARGNYECMIKYLPKHLKNMWKNFVSYDYLMLLLPIPMLGFTWGIGSAIALIVWGIITHNLIKALLIIIITFAGFYIAATFLAFQVTIHEWKNINAPARKKILYIFTFGANMLLFLPAVYIGMFPNVKWKPIRRNVLKSIDELEKENQKETSEQKN